MYPIGFFILDTRHHSPCITSLLTLFPPTSRIKITRKKIMWKNYFDVKMSDTSDTHKNWDVRILWITSMHAWFMNISPSAIFTFDRKFQLEVLIKQKFSFEFRPKYYFMCFSIQFRRLQNCLKRIQNKFQDGS